MKYIIMCGGSYPAWQTPRQLVKVQGEPIVVRTIRLLREHGVEDIAISSNDPVFNGLGVPVLRHSNSFIADKSGAWVDAFYPMDAPVCYLFGDVVFSPEAIRQIVETQSDDVAFFASAPPFGEGYPKNWPEPFAFKVGAPARFRRAINDLRWMRNAGWFDRETIAWELWNVISGSDDVNRLAFDNYCVINDYTCDIDRPQDVGLFDDLIEKL